MGKIMNEHYLSFENDLVEERDEIREVEVSNDYIKDHC